MWITKLDTQHIHSSWKLSSFSCGSLIALFLALSNNQLCVCHNHQGKNQSQINNYHSMRDLWMRFKSTEISKIAAATLKISKSSYNIVKYGTQVVNSSQQWQVDSKKSQQWLVRQKKTKQHSLWTQLKRFPGNLNLPLQNIWSQIVLQSQWKPSLS